MCPGQRMQLAARGLPLKAGTLQPALMLQGSALWAMPSLGSHQNIIPDGNS